MQSPASTSSSPCRVAPAVGRGMAGPELVSIPPGLPHRNAPGGWKRRGAERIYCAGQHGCESRRSQPHPRARKIRGAPLTTEQTPINILTADRAVLWLIAACWTGSRSPLLSHCPWSSPAVAALPPSQPVSLLGQHAGGWHLPHGDPMKSRGWRRVPGSLWPLPGLSWPLLDGDGSCHGGTAGG